MRESRSQEETFEIIAPGHTYESVTEKISSLVLNNRIAPGWLMAVGFTAAVAGLLFLGITVVLIFGVGVWGNHKTV